MSAAWVVQSLVGAVLLSVAALAVERAASWVGRPVRGIWTAAMLATVALPVLALVAPGLLPGLDILPDPLAVAALEQAIIPLPDMTGGSADPATDVRGAPWLAMALIAAWALVTAAMLAAVAWTYARFRRLRADAERAEVEGLAVRVAERAGPAVMGLRRPEIVLPRWVLELPEEERKLILAHEHEHLLGRDSLLLFAGTVLVAAMPWCLPLWWQHRRLRQAIETDCDARVLARGASRRSYGRILIRTASTTPGIPLLNPAWGESTSQLERRIMRMTAKPPRHPLARSIPLLAVALVTVAAACSVAGSSATSAPLTRVPAAMQMNATTISYAPASRLGETGIAGFDWPEGGGPAFADSGFTLPTRHVVIRVRQGSRAWNAGLRDGDAIVAVNGVDSRTVVAPFSDHSPGKRYDVRVRRGAQEHDLTLEFGPPVG